MITFDFKDNYKYNNCPKTTSILKAKLKRTCIGWVKSLSFSVRNGGGGWSGVIEKRMAY